MIDSSDLEIKLGEKYENNYTVEALKKKFPDKEFETNYVYFRARSTDIEKIKWLSDNFGFMSIIPLDREIVHGGTYWNDPGLKEGESPWYYFLKTTEEYNEAVNQEIETEIIDELCLYTGDYYDLTERKSFFGFLAAKGKVKIVIRFQNPKATLYSTSPSGLASTFVTGAVDYYEGEHYVEGLSNMDIKISGNGLYARCATIMNAVSDYHDFCNEYGITAPEHLKIIEVGSLSNSCAPVASYLLPGTTQTVLEVAKSFLCSPAGTPTASAISVVSPDIIIGTSLDDVVSNPDGKELTMTETVYRRVFHELSHASHFFGLGLNGPIVWSEEYEDMVKGWKEVSDRGENLQDNTYNNGGTDLVKLIESWGYYSENYIMTWKFRNKSLKRLEKGEAVQDCSADYPVRSSYRTGKYTYTIHTFKSFDGLSKDYINRAEASNLDYDKSIKYFSYDGFWDLIDSNQDTVNTKKIDFTDGYTYPQLFRALCQSGVKKLDTFSTSLVRITGRTSDLENVRKTIYENIQ